MTKLYIDIFENEKGIKAFFSTKYGASNGSPYYHEEVLQQLGLEDKILVQPQQVHEASIGIIGEKECRIIGEDGNVIQAWSRTEKGPEIDAWIQGNAAVPENPQTQGATNIRLPRTDGIITDQKDILLTTVHADCLPVWFYDEEHKAIGLVHAGWRGTLAGIAPKAVKLMEETYGSDPTRMKAYIGPGISKCCFETGPEVIEAFREDWGFADKYAEPAACAPRWKTIAGDEAGGAELEGREAEGAELADREAGGGELGGSDASAETGITEPGKYYIDLKGINTRELLQAGLKEENITVSSHCTCCEPDTFASYRREGGTYMRMGAGICIE